MNNDILPPNKRPQPAAPPQTPSTPPNPAVAPPAPQALLDQPDSPLLLEKPKRRSLKKIILRMISGLVLLLVLIAVGLFVWYKAQLAPVSSDTTHKIRTQIVTGSSPAQIGQLLEEKKIIRSQIAFDIYTRLSGTQAALQAGTYSLSPSESTEQIVAHLVAGKTDEFAITFLPGATLAENKAGLLKSGYSETEVDSALAKTYDHPLFADKPADTDLEGYIYGETYHFAGDATVEQVLTRTFDEYYEVIQNNNLVEGFKAQGLNLYEGITLASIIQREVSNLNDQKQVAQVFYKRLAEDMPLGADATFVYGAKKLGVAPSVGLDSPYNTRIHAGLPPGPIAAPGVTALQATASPAQGDYLFFVSGDDGVNHFSRTQEEHDANAKQYCRVNCSLF